MELTKKDNVYKLIIATDATLEKYKNVLNYLIEELKPNEVNEVNDFDTYYHLFTYRGNKLVLNYSNFYGISIFLFDETISADSQEKILMEISEILSKVPL